MNNNQPLPSSSHHVSNSNNNNNYLISSPIPYQTLPEQNSFDNTFNHYHHVQIGLSALLQNREQVLLEQHHHHNSSLNQWQLKEKTIHHILEKLTIQKQRLTKKLKKLKQDVYRMHQIEKSNKMSHQIGGKSKQQQMPPPMSISSQQALATPLSLLLDDPSIDSQNPTIPSQTAKETSPNFRNVQSSVNNLRKPVQNVNINSTTSAPYSMVLDATPSDTHTFSELPSPIRNQSRKQVHNSVPNSSSTLQATNSSIVFTNNPSY